MSHADIQSIRNFKSLVKYLRTKLEWPIDEDDADDLTFEYEPEELGLSEDVAVKVREIKQVRPLVDGQPWGIFWIDFEPKRLPVVAMRRILSALVRKKRARRSSQQAVWDLNDLMFISATGEGNHRGINFAHFRENADGQPQLRTFSWDANERHFYYLEKLNLEALHWPQDPTKIDVWRQHWASAFTTAHGEVIATAKDLASRMADLAASTRELVNEVMRYEKKSGPLHKLYDSFKRVLISDLSEDDFADMYAQTVTYGLFSARATHTGKFALENVVSLVPNTNPFLRDLLEECLKVGIGGKHQIDLDELGVSELIEVLSSKDTNIEAVLHDFGRQSREHKEDPVIHFYESFLREYDPDKKAKRGVFYTPDPVVSFIVRSVDYLLRTEFDCPDGLADTGTMTWKGKTVPKVLVLDPAVGTGTFHKYVIEQIYETFTNRAMKRGLSPTQIRREWNEYVPKHLLPRLYGFELMMAPYAVAHMKLGLALRETEYNFASDERLRVYLTNALQPAHEIPRTDSMSLAHEAEEANNIKNNTPITVVIGNPPYAKISANSGDWINDLMELYKKTVRIEEIQIQALSDDYAKFLRLAHNQIVATGRGIIGMITNNGYLDGPLFRDMRNALLQDFDHIWILNLLGDSRKRATGNRDVPDENVFDIQQGVAIVLMVRTQMHHPSTEIDYIRMEGSRSTKYEFLISKDVSATQWDKVRPQTPHYIFLPYDQAGDKEWKKSWELPDIFRGGTRVGRALPFSGAGFTTRHDLFAVAFDEEELLRNVREFLKPSATEEDLRKRFHLCTTAHWSFSEARKHLTVPHARENVVRFLYRPFDWRVTSYTKYMIGEMRPEVMSHLLHPNTALVTTRRVTGKPFDNFMVANTLVEYKAGTHDRNTQVFPLYLYQTTDDSQAEFFADNPTHGKRRPNLSPQCMADLSSRLNLKFIPDGIGDLKKTFGPEDVFHYIYAIFHSPTYRGRYAEFLKIDFPRVPLTRNVELFRTLAALGAELVALHLMESPAFKQPITEFVGKGDNVVAAGYPKYEKKTVWINGEQGFEGVPQNVWEFQIGGYQVCHKWLRDRRGRKLSTEDKVHYAKIVVALKETARLMKEIDAAIPSWPIE